MSLHYTAEDSHTVGIDEVKLESCLTASAPSLPLVELPPFLVFLLYHPSHPPTSHLASVMASLFSIPLPCTWAFQGPPETTPVLHPCPQTSHASSAQVPPSPRLVVPQAVAFVCLSCLFQSMFIPLGVVCVYRELVFPPVRHTQASMRHLANE